MFKPFDPYLHFTPSIPSFLKTPSSPLLPVDPSPTHPTTPVEIDKPAPPSEFLESSPADNSTPTSESPPSPPVDNSSPTSESPPSLPVDNSSPTSESPPSPPVDNSSPTSESPPSPPIDNSAPTLESPPSPLVDNSAPTSESPPSPPVDNSAPTSESSPAPPIDNSTPASESPPAPPIDNSPPTSESPPAPPIDNSTPTSESPPAPPIDNSPPTSESPPSPPVDNSVPASKSPPSPPAPASESPSTPPVDNSSPSSESPPSPPVDNSASASESPPLDNSPPTSESPPSPPVDYVDPTQESPSPPPPPVDNSAPTSESPPSPQVDNSAPASESPPSPPADYSAPTSESPLSPPANNSIPSSPDSSFVPPNSGSRNASPITPSSPIGSSSSPWQYDPTLSPPNPRNNKGITVIGAFGISIAAIFVVLLVVILIWCLKRRQKTNEYSSFIPTTSTATTPSTTYSQDSGGAGGFGQYTTDNMGNQAYAQSDGAGNSKSWFTYEELNHATDNFAYKNILGEGGFGCVYKGVLHDKREVAVKQLKDGGGQGEREFQAEVDIISRVHHRYLVSLVGYCTADKQRLLVYDYVPNGTLHCHLHGKGGPVMDWTTRLKVAAGSARGLAYLHEDCHPRIIHRDIKTSNILLDENFEAKVADFGLAKLTADTNTHVSTRVMGTFGYMAPEYASSGKLTDRSDVFSFGVVLLELITGRKPVDSSRPVGEESLVEMARPLLATALECGKFDQLPDPRLENNFIEKEMYQMIELANVCIRYNAQMRPRMGKVMRVLDNIVDSRDLNNGVMPGQTQIFDGGSNGNDMKTFQKLAFSSQDYSSDFSRGSVF